MPITTESDRSNAVEQGTDILESVNATRVTIDWQRSLPWWHFLSGFVRLGWRLSHVLFGTVAVWLSLLGWQIASRALTNPPRPYQDYPDITAIQNIDLLEPIRILASADWRFDLVGLATLVVLFVWLALVWGFFGGIICRRSVVELGARTTIGWSSPIRLVISRLRAIFEAVGLPALAAAVLCLIPFMLGLIGRLGTIGEVVASIGVLLTFIVAMPVAWLLLLVVLGFPLMVAAIVTEKDSDAFDGLSRSAAYLFQRPVTIMIWAIASFMIISGLTWLVCSIYWASTNMYFGAYAAGANIDSVSDFGTGFASGIWTIVKSVFGLLVYGMMAAMFWAATAAVYLVVRREVDHTEYDELDLQEIGAPLALPPVDFGRDGIIEIGAPQESKPEPASKEEAPVSANEPTT